MTPKYHILSQLGNIAQLVLLLRMGPTALISFI